MRIGVPKEIKPQETRIGLTPDSVKVLVSEGHDVLVENNGGFEAGFDNDQYIKAGAKIATHASDIFNDSDIIVKVKEPQKTEVDMIKEDQIVYTYLHLAAAKELTKGLIKSKSINIAYETVTDDNGRLPLLAPMSAVAGRMSVQAGAHCLEKNQKGRGILLGGAPGGEPANVLILGGGVVGENAATIATGMKAKVHIVDKSEERLKQLVQMFGDKIIPEQIDKIDQFKGFYEVKKLPLKAIADGRCYVQDPSTSIAPYLLNPDSNHTVLDACASPGGKTAILSSIMSNEGKIIASDIEGPRSERLLKNLKRLGVKNTEILSGDLRETKDALENENVRFDRILVDAPCSNSGVFRRRADAKWRLMPNYTNELIDLQLELLSAVIPLMKKGGKLVYSTCSIDAEENTGVISKIIETHTHLEKLDEVQLIPNDINDGAYAALLG